MPRNERSIYMASMTTDLLYAVIRRNADAAADAMDNIATTFGGVGILNACRAVAEIARQVAYPYMERGDGSLEGPIMTIQRDPDVDINPRELWAAQFFAAHVNGDDDTVGALFLSGLEDNTKDHAARVVTLMTMCAEVIRRNMRD